MIASVSSALAGVTVTADAVVRMMKEDSDQAEHVIIIPHFVLE
jgi:hypothetical protein